MKHYKVNTMKGKGENAGEGYGPGLDHLDLLINTNQYVCWTFINDQRYKSFSRICRGDILHILISKSKKQVYYRGEVLSDLIVNEEYNFSKNILYWDWSKLNRDEDNKGKQEFKYIVQWEKQEYPNDELYKKIMNGFNAQTVKEIQI